ncbi:glycosyltransferase family 4 protein [Brytella acorum]|uniref:Glycosyltransferase n=1 Tax=Brytella acorum TaxID=2959299 RepID=A0AA35VBK9_9PROT|nr:glycosyltransferase [Brytella acorum]MDF3625834.1 glycosyltransferase [Brytella acorum]CAI9121262.1 glycosyltransferase [Brytella acorum]
MNRTHKVVHVVVAGDIGGAERLLVDLTTRPAESGAEHCVALMTPNPKLRAYIAASGVPIRDRGPVRADPFSYLWRAFGPGDVRWLRTVLKEECATTVHVHTYASHVIGVRAARSLGLPVLRTEHGVQHYTDPSCALFRSWALRHTDCVVAVSDYVRRFVSRRAPFVADRIRVVRNGVDTCYFAPASSSLSGPFTLALVCRLEPWKQVDLVIRAAARVPGLHVRIAGDGSACGALKALTRKLGITDRIVFMGYQSDPRPVIAACDAAINTSRDEPLGLSVMEALSMGLPVVAFDGGGIPEIVHDGATGWLVRRHDVEALAETLTRVAASRAEAARRGRAAYDFVQRECRIEMMCERYANAYASLRSARHADA